MRKGALYRWVFEHVGFGNKYNGFFLILDCFDARFSPVGGVSEDVA